MINVTAAIIERNGNILLAKRSSNSSLPDKWEFPGGKVDAGETPEQCLARELYEEFDIIVAVGKFIAESVYQYEQKTVRLIAFQVYTDANITTLIAAIVLFSLGTGPVKGFAVTLSIGILTSMFTAIVGTRAIVNLVYGNRSLEKISI